MTAPSIDRFLDEVGITPPEGLTLANELRQAINRTATVNPVADLAAALLAGTVTADQAGTLVADAARTLTEREKAREVARDLAPTLDRLTRNAILADADRIIEAMRGPFDQAVAAIANAAEVIGITPDDATIGRLGPAASVHWEQHKTARGTLVAVRRIRSALAEVGYGTNPVGIAAYLASAPDAPTLEQATQLGHGHQGLARLAAHGTQLRLNTANEAAQIEAGARLATETADQADRDAAKELNRKQTQRYIDDWHALSPKAAS